MVFPICWEEIAQQIESIPMGNNAKGKTLVVGLDDYWIA
jgi:hypothetical protein